MTISFSKPLAGNYSKEAPQFGFLYLQYFSSQKKLDQINLKIRFSL